MDAEATSPPDPPATYAVGIRFPLRNAPEPVLAVVTDALGEPVAEIVDARGGMAPGAAAVVRGRSGRAVFVKAAGARTNPLNVTLYRREAEWGFRLPQVPGIVGPIVSRDVLVHHAEPDADGSTEEDWVVTVFPAIAGRPPQHPWLADDLWAVLDAWLPLAEAFTPSPYDEVDSTVLAGFFTGWQAIADDPADPWHSLAERWLPLEQEFVAAIREGDSFTHSDLRADNIVLGTHPSRPGRVHFVDWVHASRGPRWIDPLLLVCDVVGSGSVTRTRQVDLAEVWRHAAFAGADTGLLEAGIGVFGGIMHAMSRRPPNPSIPTIREWQRVQAGMVLEWLDR